MDDRQELDNTFIEFYKLAASNNRALMEFAEKELQRQLDLVRDNSTKTRTTEEIQALLKATNAYAVKLRDDLKYAKTIAKYERLFASSDP